MANTVKFEIGPGGVGCRLLLDGQDISESVRSVRFAAGDGPTTVELQLVGISLEGEAIADSVMADTTSMADVAVRRRRLDTAADAIGPAVARWMQKQGLLR